MRQALSELISTPRCVCLPFLGVWSLVPSYVLLLMCSLCLAHPVLCCARLCVARSCTLCYAYRAAHYKWARMFWCTYVWTHARMPAHLCARLCFHACLNPSTQLHGIDCTCIYLFMLCASLCHGFKLPLRCGTLSFPPSCSPMVLTCLVVRGKDPARAVRKLAPLAHHSCLPKCLLLWSSAEWESRRHPLRRYAD